MNLNAITLAISRPGGVRSWDPLAMFTSGVQGVWYDPSDITTLYRDAAGTQPVTAVEQPVGLMLDKSKGLVLGPELVTNGDFSNGTTGWTTGAGANAATLSVTNGVLRVTSTTTYGRFYPSSPLTTVAGTWYAISFDIAAFASGNSAFRVGTFLGGADILSTQVFTGSGRKTFIARASTATTYLWFENGSTSGGYQEIGNVSVKSLNGNHAFNSSGNSANFPVLSARYNLLTKTEDFSDAVWAENIAGSKVSTVEIGPNGKAIAVKINNAAGTGAGVRQATSFSWTGQASIDVWLKSDGTNNTCSVLLLSNGTLVTTLTITDLTSDWKKYTVTGSATSGTLTVSFQRATVTGFFFAALPDLRVANDALNQPAYQRVNTATDYDTVGFKPYLKFNGTNQWLQTNIIDFTYGDKMFVSAGVRKLSDAATATFIESSAAADTNDGAFYFRVPVSGFAAYDFVSRGTAIAEAKTAIANYPAPITNVVSGVSNISAPSAALRINGSQVDLSTANQGTGNYGNYPLYIGARGGSSLWFNGRLYSLIVAGKLANAVEITETETYINQKTGAF